MSFDIQMSRSHNGEGWNLALGEPVALQEGLRAAHAQVLGGNYAYPKMNGEPELVEVLRKKYPGKHIVVANGAKHALLASFYALRDRLFVYHRPPYWPSYPTLAKIAGLKFVDTFIDATPSVTQRITCETYPNNPAPYDNFSSYTPNIWDAVYADKKLYGWDGEEVPAGIKIEGAAKMFGLAGLRVGWLVTPSEAIAREASNYVEMTTSGVCVSAQRHVAGVFTFFERYDPEETIKAKVGKVIKENGAIWRHYLRNYIPEEDTMGVPVDHPGMFAFFKTAGHSDSDVDFKEALSRAKVSLVTGEACGYRPEFYGHWWRMNMGHTNDYTEQALKALSKELGL